MNYQLKKLGDGSRQHFASHLLPHLLVERGKDNLLNPLPVILIFWSVAIVALAGPSWQRQNSPFADDQAALVVVIKANQSMLAKDIQPSRLERAVQKTADLLALRGNAATALIAYSGSAHQVLPLTRDPGIIVSFAKELGPEIMPREGNVLAEALKMAAGVLKSSGKKGSILVIADIIDEQDFPALHIFAQNLQPSIQILAMAPETVKQVSADSPSVTPLDRASFQKAADIVGANLFTVTADNRDVMRINSNIVRNHKRIFNDENEQRWKDSGYFLLPFLLAMSLLWCRRGWYLRWKGE